VMIHSVRLFFPRLFSPRLFSIDAITPERTGQVNRLLGAPGGRHASHFSRGML